MLEGDIAIVGAGAAGLSLAHRLTQPPATGPLPGAGPWPGPVPVPGSGWGSGPGPRPGSGPGPWLIVIEPPPGHRPPPRTWCFWEPRHGPHDRAVTASWRHLRVHDRRGRAVVRDIAPLRYKMIRSPDFEALVTAGLDRCPGVRRLDGFVRAVSSAAGGAHAELTGADGAVRTVRTRWLFDSRPPPGLPAARTTLLQHFHGWFVRTRHPAFDPGVADLMDFRTPQPAHGLSFGYVLPTGRHEALVEYTEFSRAALSRDAYRAALHHYTQRVLGLGELQVTATETGVIAMTDAHFPRHSGASVFRIGAAGGATRPATGYTFSAIQRQAAAITDAYRAGRRPLPPRPYPPRSRLMDSVLLHALDSGTVDGADFFCGLFRDVPATRLLRFMDGATRLHEDLSIGIRTPVLAMLRSAAELPRLTRRPFPPP